MPGMVELKDGSYTLGRADPSDIVIPIPTVSARHAQLDVGARPLQGWSCLAFLPDATVAPLLVSREAVVLWDANRTAFHWTSHSTRRVQGSRCKVMGHLPQTRAS